MLETELFVLFCRFYRVAISSRFLTALLEQSSIKQTIRMPYWIIDRT